MNRCAGYGVALALAFLTAVSAAAAAAQESVLYSFQGSFPGGRDGFNPQAGLIADAKGVLYGTTYKGGAPCECGTVFALSPPTAGETQWTETVLYSFRGGRDGRLPLAGLIAGATGVLYGTTAGGGDNNNGTVFALSPPPAGETRWTETVLHRFRGSRHGGFPLAGPAAGLIADAKGVLYGTTYRGGDTSCDEGCGTVFALSPPTAGETRWTETVLHRFRGSPDGAGPAAGLIADANGVLYGTTQGGGDEYPFCDCGTVFALSPPAAGETRWTETVLHRFRGGGRGGSQPVAGLIADTDGVLYGTTSQGGDTSCGSPNGCGTVFALSPPTAGETRWTETVLVRFRGPDGAGPAAGLIADANGVLYGTTGGGGNGYGTVFALSPPVAGETRWTETVLHRFRGSRRDGHSPSSGLVADANGVLYGTTVGGGDNNRGTVFALSPPAAGETR